MNNDNHLNLHLHDQMSGWLRYCTQHDEINHIYIDNILKKKCQTSTYTLYNWLECTLLSI